MLIVKFKETFRDRLPEWVQSFGMLLWGILTLATVENFGIWPTYQSLLLIIPQTSWGMIASLVGAIRLIFLTINGAWRPSAHIRAIGCVFGIMLWGSLLIGTLGPTNGPNPIVAIYSMLLILDMFSLWFAAGDAKLADLTAKSRHGG